MDRNFVFYFVIFVWLGVITVFIVKIYNTFLKLTKGVSQKDLLSILNDLIKKNAGQEKSISDLRGQVEYLKSEGLKHIQKIGIVRYNPFSGTGGNQSFVLSLLDGQGNGFVITSLHSREATRVFAKPVKNSKEAGYEFSKEEIQAILTTQERNKIKS